MTKNELAELIDTNKLRRIIDEKVAVITGTTREEEGDMKKLGQILKTTVLVLVLVGAACGIAYAIYKYLVPDYYDDDFDDEFDDDFDDDDLFEIDDEEEDSAKEASEKEKDE
ncbi:MAG: hypothetical protein IJV04_09610 [Lachnospiraceae bacterium]|nr:hypothetical protein [Lachnospiraceae bacterium]